MTQELNKVKDMIAAKLYDSPHGLVSVNFVLSLIDDYIADVEREARRWPPTEERIDIIGPNGNTGEHYEN